MTLTRRAALTGTSALLFAGSGAAGEALAEVRAASPYGALLDTRYGLWLKRPNGTEIVTQYRSAATYDRVQVLALSWFMRDIVDADQAVWMEPRLFDLLTAVQNGLSLAKGSRVPLIVTSGYRTPAHNASLESAARNSMHLYGYAADLEAPGFSPRAIALAASFYAHGGIGLYPGFTHLDVWKTRTWFGPPHHAEQPGTPAPAPTPQTSTGAWPLANWHQL